LSATNWLYLVGQGTGDGLRIQAARRAASSPAPGTTGI